MRDEKSYRELIPERLCPKDFCGGDENTLYKCFAWTNFKEKPEAHFFFAMQWGMKIHFFPLRLCVCAQRVGEYTCTLVIVQEKMNTFPPHEARVFALAIEWSFCVQNVRRSSRFHDFFFSSA